MCRRSSLARATERRKTLGGEAEVRSFSQGWRTRSVSISYAGAIHERMNEMNKARIFIVHPDPSALTLLSSMLKSLGHEIDESANDRVAVRLMERGGVDLMLAGIDPADVESLELLSYMRRKHRHVPVILLFSSPMPELARQAMRQGALAVLKYPVPATELRAAVMQALAPRCDNSHPGVSQSQSQSHSGSHAHPAEVLAPTGVLPLVHSQGAVHGGCIPAPCDDRGPGRRNAPGGAGGTRVGDRGIRPEPASGDRDGWDDRGDPNPGANRRRARDGQVVAGAHDPLSRSAPRSSVRRLRQRLADRDADRARAERRSGRSTGRRRGRLVQQAPTGERGHPLLDDVAGLPDSVQSHLLQALQEQESEGIGSDGHHSTVPDVRFLMSTSENLLTLVDQGTFRQDLFHRISVICLKLPPLRHRTADIESLAEYFRTKSAPSSASPSSASRTTPWNCC